MQKHLWLLTVLEYMTRKDKPFMWVDTHSGRGLYDLTAPEAQKIAEYKTGISKLLGTIGESAHPILQLYHSKIATLNANHETLVTYPGSAYLAAKMLRANDALHAYELHPKEYECLETNLGHTRNITLRKEDGYAGIKALYPPLIKRGGMLIDPSYEVKEEYQTVVKCMREALKRWPLGTTMIWYPILGAGRHNEMCERLQTLADDYNLECVRDEWMFTGTERGMMGSGMFVINPPYSCAETMEDIKAAIKVSG